MIIIALSILRRAPSSALSHRLLQTKLSLAELSTAAKDGVGHTTKFTNDDLSYVSQQHHNANLSILHLYEGWDKDFLGAKVRSMSEIRMGKI